MKIFSEFIVESNRKAQKASKAGRISKEGPRSREKSEPSAVVTVGLPASGKSSLAKHMAAKGDTDQHELDKSRKALGKGPAYFGQDIVKHTYDGAKKSAEQGRSTVLSNTSIPKAHRKDAINKLKDVGYEKVTAVLAPGSKKTAMRRNRKRTGSAPGEGAVPQFVMNRMAQGMDSMSKADRKELRGNYKKLHKSERFTKPAMKRSGAIKEQKTFEEFIVEAAKRIEMVKLYHGSPKSAADKIKKSGFDTSEVHASTSHDVARSFGQRKGENKTNLIQMQIPKKHVKSDAPAKALKTQGQRATDNWGREHFSVIMSPGYASKHMQKYQPIIQAPRTLPGYRDQLPKAFRQRTRTKPKKK